MTTPPQQPLPSSMPDWQPNQAAPPPPKPAKFGALAWTSLILGLVGLVACWVPIFNNVTAAAAGLGVILGIIALFGTRKVLATIGVLLCVAGIAATVAIQASWAKALDDVRPTGSVTLPPSPAASTAPPPAAEPPSSPTPNERGNLVKALGEEGGFYDEETGESEVVWAVDAMTIDAPCTADYASGTAPVNGHFIRVDLRITTSTTLGSSTGVPTFSLQSTDFSVIGPDGITENSSSTPESWICLAEAEQVPNQIGPGQMVTGSIMLDSRYTSGLLVLTLPYVEGGWEWQF